MVGVRPRRLRQGRKSWIAHLLQTLSPHTVGLDTGVPARGLHGEAYRGHVFWDELFVLPFLGLRFPDVVRALLLYRWNRLPAARRAARDVGHTGAMYPWQSGSDGREETPRMHFNPRSGRWLPDNSLLQRHVGLAVAYNTWQYYEATGDLDFLSSHGAQMLLEIARFWADLATLDASTGRYDIHGVMGPDEYHDACPGAAAPGLTNNAYTNVMAAWTLCRALDALALVPSERRVELLERLDLRAGEIARWEDVSRRLRVPFHADGVISQFEALLARLGYAFDRATIPKITEYYLARTSHGSTPSAVVHACVLARSDRPASWRFFLQALDSDLHDVQGGTTGEGVHLGAMAGTLDLAQRCYTGLEPRGDVLRLNPHLPPGLPGLAMELRYRGHWGIRLRADHAGVRVGLRRSSQPPIRIAGDQEQRGSGRWSSGRNRSSKVRCG
ncbi:hypothetical protein GCM10023195_51360 [Actinoallomurus liliacearum]|uniref:Trehalose 6-phosphate phosphorylase n=1 Tax=Actinoallomurus liliacearum TaxID=1080073 RepID=A0ABP8TRW4_9ACTN